MRKVEEKKNSDMSVPKNLPEDVTDDAEPFSSTPEFETEVKTFGRGDLPSQCSSQSPQSINQANIIERNSLSGSSDCSSEGARSSNSGLHRSDILQKIPKENNISDEEREILPDNLKTDYHDAIIVYHEKDYNEAKAFMLKIEQNITFSNGEKPRVQLYDCMGPDTGLILSQLDHNLKLCTYTFMYITEIFLKDHLTYFMSVVSLSEAIFNSNKDFSYVPLLSDRKLKLPSSIACLTSLELWNSEKMMDCLKRWFQKGYSKRKKEEEKLEHERLKWIIEERKRRK
ncbi:uncharacterized protein LOC112554021 isoform X2 [Pomacea canaliculata]|uniref:uncharacterized protein LOC112554021 isoform X2 n=1 Tax=Pomacea canaliculata TaxID=400727 RepID=UPI000D73929C|nr:uncharacterized protein LOC112554021 isoform X2 [Pomacea canaliculata]